MTLMSLSHTSLSANIVHGKLNIIQKVLELLIYVLTKEIVEIS